MNYKYSYKIANLKPTTDNTNLDDKICFSSSAPDKSVFPYEDFLRIGKSLFEENADSLFSSTDIFGFDALRILIRGILFQKSVLCDHDSILITSGLKGSLDLICRTLTCEGDTIICEEPVSKSVLDVFRANGLNIIGVPLNLDGIDTDRLESALIKNPNARFVYTMPNFQNPSGITASEEKRQQIYSIAHKYDVAIIEDDSFGDLRFGGVDFPAIKSFDKDNRVIYLNTFSNILSPSLKVGYICADSILVNKLTFAKKASNNDAGLWEQMAVCRFFNEYDYFDYTYSLASYYRKKCELMLDNLKFELPTSISFTEPEGGFFILATLPKGYDVSRFCKFAADRKLGISSITDYLTNEKTPTTSFRISFSDVSEDDIIKGVKILSNAYSAFTF